MPPSRRVEVAHDRPTLVADESSARGRVRRLVEVRTFASPSVVYVPLTELQAALRSLAASASSPSIGPRIVADGQLFFALVPEDTSSFLSLSSAPHSLPIGSTSLSEVSFDQEVSYEHELGQDGNGESDSLVSSLSEECWQLATHGGRPLSGWSAADVAHWLESFEPLARYAPRAASGGVTGSSILELCVRSAMPEVKSSTTASPKNSTSAGPSTTTMATAGTAILAPLLGVALGAHRRLLANELAVVLRANTQLPTSIPLDSPDCKTSKDVATPNVIKSVKVFADAATPAQRSVDTSITGTTAASAAAVTTEIGPTLTTETATKTIEDRLYPQKLPLINDEDMCLPPRPMSSSPSASENSEPLRMHGSIPNEQTTAGVGQLGRSRRESGRRHRRIIMASSPAAAAAAAAAAAVPGAASSRARTPSIAVSGCDASNDGVAPPQGIDRDKSKPLTPAAAYAAQKEAKVVWPTCTDKAPPASSEISPGPRNASGGSKGKHDRRATPDWFASSRGLEGKLPTSRMARLLEPVVTKQGTFGKAKKIQKTKLQGIQLAKIPTHLRSKVVVPDGAENKPIINETSIGRESMDMKSPSTKYCKFEGKQKSGFFGIINPLNSDIHGHSTRNEHSSTHEKHATRLFQSAATTSLHNIGLPMKQPQHETLLPTSTTFLRRPLLPSLHLPSYSEDSKPTYASHPETQPPKSSSLLDVDDSTSAMKEVHSESVQSSAADTRSRSRAAPNLVLDVEAVNLEADSAVDQSYEFTDAGTLVTSGFRINVDGVSRAPPRDVQPQRKHGSVPVNSSSSNSSISSSSNIHSNSNHQFSGECIKHNENVVNGEAKIEHMNRASSTGNGATKDQSRVHGGMSGAPAAGAVNRMEWGRMARGLVYFEELGRGAAGAVRKALYVPELMLVAVKAVPVHEDSRRRQLLRELKALHTVGNALLPCEAYENMSHSSTPQRRDSHRGHSLKASEIDADEDKVVNQGSDDYIDDDEEGFETGELQTPPRWRRRPSPTKPRRQPAPPQQCSPPLSPSRAAVSSPLSSGSQEEGPTPAHLKRATLAMSSAREAMQAVKVSAGRVASRCETNYAHSRGSSDDSEVKEFTPEAGNVTKSLPSSHIVSVFDAFTDPEHGTVCLVLEFMNAGSLQGFVSSGERAPEEMVAAVADSVVSGLAAIHARKQLHRDVKPGNILLDCSQHVKLSDFGLATQLNAMSLANTFTGTLTYMSPERLAGDEYSYSADVWALGLCLIALAQGSLPLPAHLGFWAVVRAVQDDPPPALNPSDGWSPLVVDFISKCLVKDPKERWLPRQLHLHPFLVQHRARNQSLPPSPPSEPTPGLIAHLKELAAAAAQWHLTHRGNKDSSNGDSGAHVNKSGCVDAGENLLPELNDTRLSALAKQLNLRVPCVRNAFTEAWAAAAAAQGDRAPTAVE